MYLTSCKRLLSNKEKKIAFGYIYDLRFGTIFLVLHIWYKIHLCDVLPHTLTLAYKGM